MFSKLQSFNPWRDEEYWCNGQCVWSNKDDCVLKGWFKRWIYENGDKESILGLRMPTISETMDVLFFSIIFGCFALPLYKTFFELNPGHGKSYKIESGKTILIKLSNISRKDRKFLFLLTNIKYSTYLFNYLGTTI